MNAPEKVLAGVQPIPIRLVRTSPGDSSLAARLRKEVDGEILFDAASRGRYSTDASIYQIEPVGVVLPLTADAARIAIGLAVEEGVPVLARGAGTSQCGQTVGAALVIDNSKYLDKVLEVDAEARTALVQPGVVLDQLNAQLKVHKLWYPVDVSTSAQATLGGMAGNNSCGSRSIAYGHGSQRARHRRLARNGRAFPVRADGRSHGAAGLPGLARQARCAIRARQG